MKPLKIEKFKIKVLLLFVNQILLVQYTFGSNKCSPNSVIKQPEKAIHNISVFNKVYGYVRHFSPALAVDTFFGWEDLLLKNLPLVEAAKSDNELCQIITTCFAQLEPNLVVEPFNTEKKPANTTSQECNGFYVHRYNKGWGNRNENATKMKFLYSSRIERCSSNLNLFKTTYENISITLPLTVCVNDSTYKLYNTTREFDPKSKKDKYSSSNKYVRLGIILEVWNVQEYFYPYMDELKIDNEAILKKYIKAVSTEMNEQQFFETLEYFGAEYKDGHAGFMPFAPMAEWPDFVPPLKIELIGNELIVTYVADTLKHLINIGDKVTSIDNISAMDFFKKKQQKISSATQTWNKYAAESELLIGYKNTFVKLDLLQNGKRKALSLIRNVSARTNDANANKIRPDIYEIKKDYYYVNLCYLTDSSFYYISENILPKAKGIVFDFRGYPYPVKYSFLQHLASDTIFPPAWTIPVKTYPTQNDIKRDTINASHWIHSPLLPKYTDNIVFLVNGRCISGAESFLAIIEHYKLGKIVGEQTAGTNGNINSFILFGLYQFWHTQMHTAKHDGAKFHGVGIIPNVNVKPRTIKDVLEGNDNFIIEAIKLLNE